MTSLTIQVLNKSGSSKVYYLFYQPFSAQYTPFACVTQKSTMITNSNTAKFIIEMPSAVVCGTSPGVPLAPGVSVNIEEYTDITPPQKVSISEQDNNPYFPAVDTESTGGDWANISTENYTFNPNAHVFCGLGVSDISGRVNPSCVWEIQPNARYPVPESPQPLVFYISSDPNLDVGTITTVKESSPNATVDFTGTGCNFCQVEQLQDNSFQVSPPSDVTVVGHRN